MGLDLVEIVMQCEERFGITIPDDEAEQITTVGGLFELICKHLGMPYDPAGFRPPEREIIPSRSVPPDLSPSHPGRDEVWTTLVEIVTDQLQVEASEVRYDAHWQRDLGAD